MATDEADLDFERTEGTRPCPVCSTIMSKERMNGVVIDVCDDHGLWLDHGELERIVFLRKAKGVQKRMRRQRQLRNEVAQRWGALFPDEW